MLNFILWYLIGVVIAFIISLLIDRTSKSKKLVNTEIVAFSLLSWVGIFLLIVFNLYIILIFITQKMNKENK